MLVLRHAEAYSRDSRDNRGNRWLKIFSLFISFNLPLTESIKKGRKYLIGEILFL